MSLPTGWQDRTVLRPDPEGWIRFEDRDVVPGERYGYRLRWGSERGATTGGETWVEVPAAAIFALEPPHPNPSGGEWSIAFELPSSGPARLEVLDVAGRRVADRAMDGARAGRHRLGLVESARLPAGVYVIRLTQGNRTLARRGSIVR